MHLLRTQLTHRPYQFTLCRVRSDRPTSWAHIIDTRALADYAIKNNLTPFISMQNHYSLVYREEEREMFPTLKVSLSLPTISHHYLTLLWLAVRRRLDPVVAPRPRAAHATPERAGRHEARHQRHVRPSRHVPCMFCWSADMVGN